ncbi:MAG TPA: DUF3987 domain-containing protein, partial [Gammaproteobacteria bacterium]|nr:DUF3987 domain-containing protein [Gammaproteobacteria bacterium]
QSLLPPSQHPSGELYQTAHRNRAAATIGVEALYLAAEHTAAAALFARYWPGARHDKALALSGALLHAGWTGDAAIEFVECVAQAALDDELEDRSRAAQDSVECFAKGDHTTGWPELSKHFDEVVLEKVRAWLNIKDELRLNGGTAPRCTQPNNKAAHQPALEEPWPEPQPLIVASNLAPYPMDALPSPINEAVKEVLSFVKCPDSLAACSALAALSLAGQGLADVRREDKLIGPCSLYLLAVADSGERKTTCDDFFMQRIKIWETDEEERLKPEVANYEAASKIWMAKCKGITRAIETATKSGKPTLTKEQELADLEANKPQPPVVPNLIYGDTTPEALAFWLATKWPSSGVLSNEAGIVFGGHAMGRESLTRNLALLNSLWDGRGHKVHRRTTEVFTVAGVRLTMGLAAQPQV